MVELDLSQRVPPEGMTMPYVPQLVFTIILHLPVLATVVLGVHHLVSKKNPKLLYFIIGGYLSSFMEPVVDINGLCYFPMDGQIVGLRTYDRDIPLFVVATYSWFMGGQGYVINQAFHSGRLTKSGLWKYWTSAMCVNLLIEIPMLLLGMYVYYGAQPFKVAGFPLWWLIVNSMVPISGGFITFTLSPHLTGWKGLFTIPIIAMADGFSNISIGWPMWNALNTDLGYAATYPAFFLTLGLGCLTIWAITQYIPASKVENGSSDPERQALIN